MSLTSLKRTSFGETNMPKCQWLFVEAFECNASVTAQPERCLGDAECQLSREVLLQGMSVS